MSVIEFMKIIMIGYWTFHNSVHKEWKNTLRNIVFLYFFYKDGTRNVIKSNGAKVTSNGILISIRKSLKTSHHISNTDLLLWKKSLFLMFRNFFICNFCWFAFLISAGRQIIRHLLDLLRNSTLVFVMFQCSIFDFCRKYCIENGIDQMLMIYKY